MGRRRLVEATDHIQHDALDLPTPADIIDVAAQQQGRHLLQSSARDVSGLCREEAAAYVGLRARKFDQLVADGRMPKPIHIDGRRVWDRRALDQSFDALGGNAEDIDNEWKDGA